MQYLWSGAATYGETSRKTERTAATPRIFPEPIPFRHDYGCVGPQVKGSIPVVHTYTLMTLYYVAPEEMLLKRN